MAKLLKRKIEEMNQWFKSIVDHGKDIHDVIEIDDTEYVIWSDDKGYTVSWKSPHGQGTSGAYTDLFGAVKYITGDSITAFREKNKKS